MKVLVTFPGRAGDILWSLPSIRALAEHLGDPVDLLICGEFEALVPLLQAQPYLGTVTADHAWPLVPPREWAYLPDTSGYDRVYQLGYRGWPQLPLPFETQRTLREEQAKYGDPWVWTMDLGRPWIRVEGPGSPTDIAVGFTTEHFELKLGILLCVEQALRVPMLLLTNGGRWTEEIPPATVSVERCGWLEAARVIRNSDLFFGDCSALQVLAVALGKPCVIVEPNRDRWQEIFWPLGTTGLVKLVVGVDGRPTVDARHCADTLRGALAHA